MGSAFERLTKLDESDYDMVVQLFAPHNYMKFCEEWSDFYYSDERKAMDLVVKICEKRPNYLKGFDIERMENILKKSKSLFTKLPKYSEEDFELNFEEEWDKLREKLFELREEDRILYVEQLIIKLQRKYERLLREWNRCQINIYRETLEEALMIYSLAMISIVNKVGVQFKLCMSEEFIFIQNDMYNQLFEEVDYFQDPECLYPNFKRVMEYHRSLLKKKVRKNDRISKVFISPFNKEQMEKVFSLLLENKLIDDNTLIDHVFYWFGIDKSEPIGLQQINWLGTHQLLAYFMQQCILKVKGEKILDSWEMTSRIFRVKGQIICKKSLIEAVSRINIGKRTPKEGPVIDGILKYL